MKKEDTFLNEWTKIKTAHENWLRICAIRGWKKLCERWKYEKEKIKYN